MGQKDIKMRKTEIEGGKERKGENEKMQEGEGTDPCAMSDPCTLRSPHPGLMASSSVLLCILFKPALLTLFFIFSVLIYTHL